VDIEEQMAYARRRSDKKGLGIFPSLLSFVNRHVSLPTNAKVYIDSVIDKKEGPITDKDFTGEELNIIRDLVMASTVSRPAAPGATAIPATPGAVNYNTYRKPLETEPRMFGLPLNANAGIGIDALFNRKSRIATTLGQFGYAVNPEGNIDVTDTYDFNAYTDGKRTTGTEYSQSNPAAKSVLALASLGVSPLAAYAQEQIPEGRGRPVRVTIPKERFGDNYDKIIAAMNQRMTSK